MSEDDAPTAPDPPDGGRAVLEHLLWELDQSFSGKPEHSLVANLSSVTNDDLDKLPPGGGRTMRDLIVHCAAVKVMHVNHAFADASHTFWTAWDGDGTVADATFEDLLEWLERAHDDVLDAVDALQSDAELTVARPTYWGELWETRRVIDAISIHDVYHAGEINHLRALLHQYAQGRL